MNKRIGPLNVVYRISIYNLDTLTATIENGVGFFTLRRKTILGSGFGTVYHILGAGNGDFSYKWYILPKGY